MVGSPQVLGGSLAVCVSSCPISKLGSDFSPCSLGVESPRVVFCSQVPALGEVKVMPGQGLSVGYHP